MRGRGYSYFAVAVTFGCSLLLGKWVFNDDPTAIQQTKADVTARADIASTADLPNKSPGIRVSQSLEEAKDGWVNTNTRMRTFIHEVYAEGARYYPARGRSGLEYRPLGMEYRNGFKPVRELPFSLDARAEIEQIGSTQRCVYKDCYPNVDEDMTIRPDGGKEHNYRLKKKPVGLDQAETVAFVSRLQMSPGMTVWDGDKQIKGRHKTTGKFVFKDQKGIVAFEVRRPVAYDDNVTASDGSLDDDAQEDFAGALYRPEYQIEVGDGYVDLAVATSTSWLNDPKRAYPVTIDPNIGPGGLSDAIYNGGQPIYTGAAGSGSFLGIHNAAIEGALTIPCPMPRGVAYRLPVTMDCDVFPILMPFQWSYYNVLIPQCTPLFIFSDGLASFEPPPWPPGCPDNTFIPNPMVHNAAMYPYWDDLALSGDSLSGVYVMMDGQVGNRRLIVEWYRMSFVRGEASDRISFNLILHECNNMIEFIIGNSEGGIEPGESTEVDRGEASVGIEDWTGTVGIQYDFNSFVAGEPTSAGEPTPLPPITPETTVIFTPVALTNMTVTVDGNTVSQSQAYDPGHCLPVRSCFDVVLIPPNQNCGDNPSAVPPSYGFQWTFTLPNPEGGETLLAIKKTPKFCHTFTIPGSVQVTLDVIDGTGTTSSFGSFTYLVCDVPRVELTASPQGGILPLTVNFQTQSSASFVETISANPADDYNTVPVTTEGLDPGFVVVEPGADGLLHTRPEGDDVLDIVNQQILAGANGINETTALNGTQVVVAGGVDRDGDGLADYIASAPAAGDEYVGINIVSMFDNDSDTTAVFPDRQVVPVGDSPDGVPGTPIWIVEKLHERDFQTPPAFIATLPPGDLDPTFTFTYEGIYKVTVIWTGVDVNTGRPTSAEYSIFIFAEDGNRPNDENLLIEGSDFEVVWKGKEDRPDDANLDPQNPNRDTIGIRGVFNLPNLVPSALGSIPIRARVTLNGTLPIFDLGDGVLNPNGSLTVKDAVSGVQRTFKMNLPGGKFSVYARKIRLDEVLGLMNVTENRLVPLHVAIELYDYSDPNNPVAIYPQKPDTRGAMITYDYRSVANGRARGRYRVGDFTGDGFFVAVSPGAPGTTTSPPTKPTFNVVNMGGQTILVSGAFIVYQANLKLQGANVIANIKGKVVRFGGDFLSLQANSDVTLQIGPAQDSFGNTIASGWSETLNLSTSPKWRARGGSKRRGPSYIFKRDKSLGQTGVKSIFLANRAGDFRIITYPIPNLDEGGKGGVGLDSTQITQVVPLNLYITHENDNNNSLQNLDARTEFLTTKTGTSTFKRK